jgi:hypothetical protein
MTKERNMRNTFKIRQTTARVVKKKASKRIEWSAEETNI